MNKTYLIAIPLVLVLAYGGYGILHKSNESLSESLVTENQGRKNIFADFLKREGSYICKIDQNVSASSTRGTTYISDNMIRGEYSTNVQGISVDTTLLIKNGYTYTWSSLMPGKGFKTKMEAGMEEEIKMQGQFIFDAQEIGDYACEPWKKDGSLFKLPDSIVFQEV